MVTLLKEKAIGNENTLRFAVVLFATYSFLCVLIHDSSLPILHKILSGLIGAMGTFLFTKYLGKNDNKNKNNKDNSTT